MRRKQVSHGTASSRWSAIEHLPLPSTMFKLIKALEFSDEETARFWEELEEAYQRDRVLQEAEAETPQKV